MFIFIVSNKYIIFLFRIIQYLNLDQILKENERRLILLNKKPKIIYKTLLKTDETLNFYISILLSLVGILICLSIPFAALESPCDIFIINDLFVLHKIAMFINNNFILLDILIVLFIVLLIIVSIKTVLDAIRNTNISISPWIERGKYTMPPKSESRRRRFLTNLESEMY